MADWSLPCPKSRVAACCVPVRPLASGCEQGALSATGRRSVGSIRDRHRAADGLTVVAASLAVASVVLDLWSRTVPISAVPAWRSFIALVTASVLGVLCLLLDRPSRSQSRALVRVAAASLLAVAAGVRWGMGVTSAPSRYSIPVSMAGAAAMVLAAGWVLRRRGRSAGPLVLESWVGTFAVAAAVRGAMAQPSVRLIVRDGDLRLLSACLSAGTVLIVAWALARRRPSVLGAALAGAVVVAVATSVWWSGGAPRWGWAAVAIVLLAVRLGAIGGLARGVAAIAAALPAAFGAVGAVGTRGLRWVRSSGRSTAAALVPPVRRLGARIAGVLAPLDPDGGRGPGPVPFAGRDRRWAWLLAALAVGTVVIDVAWAYRVGYQPIGHGITQMSQGWDVLSRHPPLVGMPTSFTANAEGTATYHPGPLMFQMFTPFVHLLGLRDAGILAAATLNLSCWLLAAWAGFRAGGRAAGVAAWIAGAVLMNGLLRDAPFEAVSAVMLVPAVFTVALLCWAAATGTRKALPIAVFLTSLVTQGYLALGPFTIVPLLWAFVVVAIDAKRGHRAVEAVRTLVLSGLLALVLWAPPIYEAARNDGGNFAALWSAARSGMPSIGARGFYLAVAWTLALPLPWSRFDRPFAPDYRAYLDGMNLVGPVLLLGFVVLAVLRRRLASVALRRGWVLAVIAMLSTAVALAQFPIQLTAFYQLLWLGAAAAFFWVVAAVTLWSLVVRPWLAARDRSSDTLRTAVLAVSSVVVLAAAIRTPASLESFKGRYAALDLAVPAITEGADRAARGPDPTLVLSADAADQQTMADVVTAHLVTQGHVVYVEPGAGNFFGRHHVVPDGWSGRALIVVDGSTPSRPPGRRVVRTEPEGWSQAAFDRTARKVAAWAREHGPIVPTPYTRLELVSYLDPWMPDATCDELLRFADGRASLAQAPDGALARLFADDALLSPQLPEGLRAELDAVAASPFELWEVDFPATERAQTSSMRRNLTQCQPS
ncbi:MAG: hypothetical protein JWO77_101 [Ilumatobacteraceae bacterium]|nr:hypothetical protein [Ilumatobacteraceae bacterium]